MSKNRILIAFIGAILATIIYYSINETESPEAYKKKIITERNENDRFMRNSEESPFVKNNISYNGLSYFEPDLKYKINARFVRTEEPKIVTLSTSDGKIREYLEFGIAHFTLNKVENKLLILENAEDGTLFLAFGDETSAYETYGAGRYLDVKYEGGNSLLLDFNLAYNPYCAYSESFSCPFPAPDNLLSIAINAGEKSYDDNKISPPKDSKD